MERLYVNQEMYLRLGAWLKEAPICTLSPATASPRPSTGSIISLTTGVTQPCLPSEAGRVSYKYIVHQGTLPGWAADWVARKGPQGTSVREALIRILLRMWHLAGKGFNLPLVLLAQNCNCAPIQVSRMLAELTSLGFLQCTDATFKQGTKAKTYIAKAELFEDITTLRMATPTKARPKQLPNLAIQGQFYHDCLAALRGGAAALLNWAGTLPNLDRKGQSLVNRMAACEERRRRAG
jgi:hypothetical protein